MYIGLVELVALEKAWEAHCARRKEQQVFAHDVAYMQRLSMTPSGSQS